MKTLCVHIATIDHKNGTNIYAAATEDQLNVQLAAFCEEHWAEEVSDLVEKPSTPAGVVQEYFGQVNDEYLFRETIPVVFPQL